MQLQELSQGHARKGTKPARMMIVKEFFGFLRRKTLDHPSSILRKALYVDSVLDGWSTRADLHYKTENRGNVPFVPRRLGCECKDSPLQMHAEVGGALDRGCLGR